MAFGETIDSARTATELESDTGREDSWECGCAVCPPLQSTSLRLQSAEANCGAAFNRELEGKAACPDISQKNFARHKKRA